jgi:hypothetical protein
MYEIDLTKNVQKPINNNASIAEPVSEKKSCITQHNEFKVKSEESFSNSEQGSHTSLS